MYCEIYSLYANTGAGKKKEEAWRAEIILH
jgi:hypothetical protein